RVYACLESLAPALLLNYRSGDLLSRLVADIDELQTLYLRVVSPLVVAGMSALLLFLICSFFSPLLAWVALTGLALACLIVPLLVWWLARGLGTACLAVRADQQAALVDGMQGLQDLLAYGQSQRYLQKIATYDRRLGVLQQRMAGISGLQEALTAFLKHGTLWCVLVLALPLVTNGKLDGIYVGCLALLVLASFEVVQPLGQACRFLDHALAAGRRLFALLDATPTVTDPPVPLALSPGAGYELAFEEVGFAYNAAGPAVLKEISFRVQSGSRVALVGSSGAGKSTLLRLVARCWDATTGCITLNGDDIRHYALSNLRALLGVVTQDTHLFNTTLRGNLLLARPEADDEQLMCVLEQAQLGEFVRQLPAGLDTWLGEQGLRLSGGERQRLAIARALLKDAPILLLDEVTANLDPQTEQEILTALHALTRDRTTLLITHRLMMMEQMDEIIVLENGAIQERGTHVQLLTRQGRYAQLYTAQQSVLTFPGRQSHEG
ncbi:MAG: thiol reductant ABC exporter subunit CydC, partial [Ktedonobacteraceae bacterium]